MHQFKTGLLVALFFVLSFHNVLAQNQPSPYSAYGVGLLVDNGYVANRGMGGIGVSYVNPWVAASKNPALLSSHTFSTFEAAATLTNSAVRDEVNRFDQFSGGLNYISLAFPVIPGRYAMNLSLRPYSSKSYQLIETTDASGGIRPERLRTTGEGSISQFSLANGFAINKQFSVGVEASYNFGNISDQTIYGDLIEGQDTVNVAFLVADQTDLNYSDFSFKFGASFRQKVGKNYLGVGATYDLQADLNTKRSVSFQRLSLTGDEINTGNVDTLTTNFVVQDQKGITRIPGKLAAGVSFWKPNKWAVAAEGYFQNWEDYTLFGEKSANLTNLIGVNVGGELTPDAQDPDKYFNRITYRVGFKAAQGPVKVQNTTISDFGITFGMTLPVNRVSNVNLGLDVGQRGTLESNLVRENYLQLNLSFTFNDKWFLRRQFD